jgi:hypothetical protein
MRYTVAKKNNSPTMCSEQYSCQGVRDGVFIVNIIQIIYTVADIRRVIMSCLGETEAQHHPEPPQQRADHPVHRSQV